MDDSYDLCAVTGPVLLPLSYPYDGEYGATTPVTAPLLPLSRARSLSLSRARRKDATTFALTCASNLNDASRFEGGTDKGRHQTDTSLRSRSSPVRCCRLFHITHVDAQRSGGRSHLRLVRREGRADSDLCRTS